MCWITYNKVLHFTSIRVKRRTFCFYLLFSNFCPPVTNFYPLEGPFLWNSNFLHTKTKLLLQRRILLDQAGKASVGSVPAGRRSKVP